MARSEHILKSTGSKKAVRQQIHWIVRWTGIQWILWSAERALSLRIIYVVVTTTDGRVHVQYDDVRRRNLRAYRCS